MKKKTICAVLAAVLVVLAGCGSAESRWETAYRETGSYLLAQEDIAVGSVGGEWKILGLSRAGLMPEDWAQRYGDAAAAYVAEIGSSRLHPVKATENARVILGLTAAGQDASSVAGIDLTAGLSDLAYLRQQGNNGSIWALIALDSGGYDIPPAAEGEEQTTRDALVAEILSCQCGDGGWSLMGERSDVDMTAMALTSLAPYRQQPEVAAAAGRGFAYLAAAQQPDGGFASWGTSNSESCAQVIVALTAWDMDPDGEPFRQAEGSVVDALCRFACDGGGFRHISQQTQPDGMATEQGFYALAAYRRYLDGETRLFDIAGEVTP